MRRAHSDGTRAASHGRLPRPRRRGARRRRGGAVHGTARVDAPTPKQRRLLLDLYRPAAPSRDARPVVILIHGTASSATGGGRRHGVADRRVVRSEVSRAVELDPGAPPRPRPLRPAGWAAFCVICARNVAHPPSARALEAGRAAGAASSSRPVGARSRPASSSTARPPCSRAWRRPSVEYGPAWLSRPGIGAGRVAHRPHRERDRQPDQPVGQAHSERDRARAGALGYSRRGGRRRTAPGLTDEKRTLVTAALAVLRGDS
jgi:hypothetical protein